MKMEERFKLYDFIKEKSDTKKKLCLICVEDMVNEFGSLFGVKPTLSEVRKARQAAGFKATRKEKPENPLKKLKFDGPCLIMAVDKNDNPLYLNYVGNKPGYDTGVYEVKVWNSY